MRRLPRLTWLVVTAVALIVSPVDGANAGAACLQGRALAAGEVVHLAGAGCELTGRLVRFGAAALRVPVPGHETTARVLTTTGEQTLTVRVGSTGTVDVRTEDATGEPVAAPTEHPTPVSPEECFSAARFQSAGIRRPPDRNLVWSYNAAGEPRAGFYMAIWLGANNMTYGVNDCGLATGVFGISHLGAPGAVERANIDSDGCTYSYDDLNIVDWGAMGPDVLAVACSRTIVTVPCLLASVCLTTSDVRFNTDQPWFVVDEVPEPGAQPLCGSASTQTFAGYDLMSVSAHEFGHVWGLDHVDESTDPRMTMSPAIGICDFSARFIGLGDHVGMCERWCPLILDQPPGRLDD